MHILDKNLYGFVLILILSNCSIQIREYTSNSLYSIIHAWIQTLFSGERIPNDIYVFLGVGEDISKTYFPYLYHLNLGNLNPP